MLHNKLHIKVFRINGIFTKVLRLTMELVNRLEAGPLSLVCMATFGVGLSWGFALLDFAHVYFGGVETYTAPAGMPTRAETIKKWIEYYRGGNA